MPSEYGLVIGQCVEDPIIPFELFFFYYFYFFTFLYQRCILAISWNSLSNVMGKTESNNPLWDMDNIYN